MKSPKEMELAHTLTNYKFIIHYAKESGNWTFSISQIQQLIYYVHRRLAGKAQYHRYSTYDAHIDKIKETVDLHGDTLKWDKDTDFIYIVHGFGSHELIDGYPITEEVTNLIKRFIDDHKSAHNDIPDEIRTNYALMIHLMKESGVRRITLGWWRNLVDFMECHIRLPFDTTIEGILETASVFKETITHKTASKRIDFIYLNPIVDIDSEVRAYPATDEVTGIIREFLGKADITSDEPTKLTVTMPKIYLAAMEISRLNTWSVKDLTSLMLYIDKYLTEADRENYAAVDICDTHKAIRGDALTYSNLFEVFSDGDYIKLRDGVELVEVVNSPTYCLDERVRGLIADYIRDIFQNKPSSEKPFAIDTEMADLAFPLIKYLRTHHNPYTKIEISDNGIDLTTTIGHQPAPDDK